MPEQLDQAESVSLWDFMAGDETDAAGRPAAHLLMGLHSYPPAAVAIVDLGIPELLAGQTPTAEEAASVAGTAPDPTARLPRAGIPA
jgi:hypothetical protein